MENSINLKTTTTKAPSENPNPHLPTKTREEGELSSSDDGNENPNGSTVQSTLATGSGSVPLVQRSTQGVQGGGSNNIQMRMIVQPISRKGIKKNQLPPKSAPWTGHVGDDKNLVISFSDDDSGTDIENKGTESRLVRNIKRPSSSLENSNKLQLQQNARSLHREIPKKLSSNRTLVSSVTTIPSTNSKGAGSWSLGQGKRTRNFNLLNKTLASQERGRDQGAISNDNKLQDLRHQIALRESELKMKAAQQNKESASVLGRDQNAMTLKNDTARKNIPVSSGAAHLEPKEPDRKRMKLDTSHDTPQAVGGQKVPVVKSILPSKDSVRGNIHPQERNKADHNQKEIPSCRGESTIIISQRQPDNHLGNSLQNMPCISREGDVNYGCKKTGKSSKLVDPCVAFNHSAMPANMPSNSVPTNLEAVSNAVVMNHNGNANVSEHTSIDLQSLFGMEELIDKELEEAQENRHNCEIEERNAHRAYLKAQRSLIEANARCNNLYRQRELYSAKLRSLILNNSSLSLGQHQQLDIGLDYLPKLGYEIPTSSCLRQAENNINNPSFDSNNQGINNRQSDTSYHHTNGANLESEPCVEPDASTSEPLPQRVIHAADGVYSPMDEFDTSDNENEEISLAGDGYHHLDAEYHRKQDSKEKQMDVDTASNANCSTDSPQDCLLLEATLRSELFARLGKRTMKSSSACNNIDTAELGAENEVGSEKIRVHHGIVPSPNAENNDLRGIERKERNIYLDSNEIQSQQNIGGNTLNANCSAGSGDQGDMPFQGQFSTNPVNIPPLIFRSAFSELREMSPFSSDLLPNQIKSTHNNDGQSQNATCPSSDEAKRNMLASSMYFTIGNTLSEEGSYGCSPEVDPFWPLCMYELRGKCNNDECPWQHAKDYGDGNINQHQHTDSNNGDSQDRFPLQLQNWNGVTNITKYHKATIMPTYLVSLDILKADQFAYKPIVAHRLGQYWQQHFSITLATSNLLQNGSPADGPLSHGGDERIEVRGAWSKQFSFKWRNGVGNQIKQAMADSEQAVEMALLTLNQEINKLQGVRKALSVLSKALKTDPSSVILWIVYLLICYGSSGPTEKEDIFLRAVKLYKGSYVLWLMYINSRRTLDDRLASYDSALSALCQHASAAPEDRTCESACILDLFLQMIDCLCMSGNVEKAIQRSYGVFPATTKSDEPNILSLSDILNCLTISDKCVLWVCCVYLVIYRKLPGAVVQKFECEKDLLDIEWPFVSLSEFKKERAVKLMETAVEYINCYPYNESMKSEDDLQYAQLFAVNHLRCMVALDSLECLRDLLNKYVKLYPSCIELVLVSAQIREQNFGVDSLMVFEDAIGRWSNIVPGIQCIWNQYIANAIHNRKIDLAKEITVRWFRTVWQVLDPPYDGMDATDDGNYCGLLGLGSKFVSDTLNSGHKQIDMMFGYLNLFVYYFFQNDKTQAYIAVNKARNTVSFVGLEQYIKKYVMFLVCDASSLKEADPKGAIKRMLEVYMDDSSQALLTPRVLTRKFVENIKKPRVHHLIGNILRPVSFDCSLLNLILQSWFGSSLLPQTVSDPKQLVDFVEGIMEVVPYNFQLAFAVCKLLSKDYSSSDLNSTSLWFWACSTLVNSIMFAIPIPPEYVWVEAAKFLHNAIGIEAISQRFYKKALSVYPFSIMLWKCYYKLFLSIGDANNIVEEAKEKGINLDLVSN